MHEPVVAFPVRIAVLSLLGLIAIQPLAAVAPPEATTEKGASVRMLDARVNAEESYRNAIKPRGAAAANGLSVAQSHSAAIAEAIRDTKKTIPGLEASFSNQTGGPRLVRNSKGTLTGPAKGVSSETIVRGFLGANRAMYGLTSQDLNDLVVLGDSLGGKSGLRMLRMEQRVNGIPVFQSETRFILDRDGRLVQTTGQFVPHARAQSVGLDVSKHSTPGAAVIKLLGSLGKFASEDAFAVTSEVNGRLTLSENADYVAGDVTAQRVLFPLAPGLLVPGWSLVVFTEGDADWYAVVDAETGDVLWRKNIRNYVSTHDARFRVFVQADGVTPADNPAPASPNTVTPGSNTQFPFVAPSIVSMFTAQDITASPNGWINDCPGGVCTANETQTIGNNTLTCLDRAAPANVCDTDAGGMLDGNGRPVGNPDANARNRDFLGTAPRDFQTNFLPPPQTTAADAEVGQTATGAGASGTNALDIFRRGAVTHLFYVTNWYHDKLFALGFDEAAGNFQQTNFSGMGLGGDRVLADAQDASGTNNANFATPPDGVSGRMQMYRFTGPTIDRDGGLDAEIVIHELTHGLSNRLVGNAAGLNWDPAAGLGEGWSDFYALSLLNNTNADDPNGQYAAGSYATYKLGGLLDNYLYAIRRFPYSTNNTINPMTWADVDDVTNSLTGGIAPSPLTFNNNGGMEVHNSGEVWALTLWEARARVIADPAGANGDVPTGNNTMLQIVTDALKLTPIDPTFVEARDALFVADCAANACANETSIWGGFADRGLGYGAATPYDVAFGYTASHMGIRESFSLPYLDVVDPSTDVAIDDTASNNNGAIDPGEAIRITVTLTNPWRAASRNVTAGGTATLTTATAGITIYDNASVYPAIAAQGTGAGDSFMFTVDPSVLCGSSLDFTLTTTTSLGTTATTFRLRVGNANGTDPVVTYTRDTNPDLPIVDSRPRASFDQMTITDDFEIADLDFRLDSVTHTFTGDLTFMLRSPGGIGVDQVSLIGGLIDGGPGDNIVNMITDDEVANISANDMVQATSAAAPYTKSWIPVFNGPWAALAGFPPSDPVGTFSRLDGTSTQGVWSVAASDQFLVDSGTLNAWSMLVTPVHFDCVPFAPAVVIGATKTVSGLTFVGSTVTYTVTLTNSGTTNQADNAGDEFIDVLPASLTLVSANATSGTAVATVGTNTVTWNGSLAPLGGSVTITITATIDPGTQGTVVSNQGTFNFDADGNGTNESSVLTDDPSVGGASDPTSFTVASGSLVSATKVASGTFVEGSALTYTVVLTNTGAAAQADNAGNEFNDVLPPELTLVSATATSGTAIATIGTNTVTWNGAIAASGGTVTITINATINLGTAGLTVTNQGTFAFDNDGNATNESAGSTDDPAVGGATDPTSFVVAPLITVPYPGNPLLGPSTLNGYESCDVTTSPAATLLLPYFQVDPSGLGENTLVTVSNASDTSIVAHVTVWSNWSFPVLDFNLFLTGYDAVSLSLRDLLVSGNIPNTARNTATSPRGVRSTRGGTWIEAPYNAGALAATCAGSQGGNGAVPGFLLSQIQSGLTGGPYSAGGVGCSQVGDLSDDMIGYITFDTSAVCSQSLPTDAAYFSTEVRWENQLVGEYVRLNDLDGVAGANPLVHIKALPGGDSTPITTLPWTFYNRYQGGIGVADRRAPLPALFAGRYIEAGTALDTDFVIWREGVTTGPETLLCNSQLPRNASFPYVEIVRFDERENVTTRQSGCQVSPCSPDQGLGESQLINVNNSSFIPGDPSADLGGWVYFNLSIPKGDPESWGRPSQNWVQVRMTGAGLYGVDFDAAYLGNGCQGHVGITLPDGSSNGEKIGPKYERYTETLWTGN